MKYNIDFCETIDNLTKIQGWGFDNEGNPLVIECNHEFRLKKIERYDVVAVFNEQHVDAVCGFEIYIKKRKLKSLKSLKIIFSDKKSKKSVIIRSERKAKKKKDRRLAASIKLDKTPLISIVIPVYNTEIKYFDELISSIKSQSYSNWELCLGDGNSCDDFKDYLKMFESDKIKIAFLDKNYGISGNTNEAIKISAGEYIAFCDHDDILDCNALLEIAKEINREEFVDFIYTDEDKVTADPLTFFQPNYKSDFNINLLEVGNYVNHLSVIKKELLDKIGWLNSNFDGSQDYDLVLRVAENTKNISHIKKILYHWRSHENSVSENPASKDYAYDNAVIVLKAHFERIGEDVYVERTNSYGSYRIIRGKKDD